MIVTIYKCKGDRRECGNYRGISLLCIAGKVLAKIALLRQQEISERILPEPTIKAFDFLGRDALWRIMMKYGCPPRLLAVIKAFHTDMRATVTVNGETSDFFQVLHGVKQGCILAPTLFLAAVIEEMADNSLDGIYIRTRSDGGLFNISRLKSQRHVLVKCIRELLYADDSALVSHTLDGIQRLLEKFAEAVSNYVRDRRTGEGAADFGRLKDRLWKVKSMRLNTKLNVYKAVVLSALLYGLEVSTLYARHDPRLSVLVQRYLRGLMGITWKDHITNVETLRRANISSIEAMIARSQLRWTGHVIRMSEERLPRALLFAELKEGTRPRGRPRLRFKDTVKRRLTLAGISYQQLEKPASDRAGWRSVVVREPKRPQNW
nr:uncharacterized protein LOC113818771 [Penaeus vannamei]